MKGLEISNYYPIPALRTMGDSDFVVEKNDLNKASSLIESLGYKLKEAFNEKVYVKNDMEVELHYQLLYDDQLNKENEVKFFKNMFEYVDDNKLNPSYHFIFLLLHLKKHILYRGCGFRQFVDLAVFSSNKELDWDYINKSLKELDLLKFYNVCASLIFEWFGIKIENNIEQLDKDFLDYVTKTILKNGVFGWNNKENELNTVIDSLNNTKDHARNKRKISYIFERLFPSYNVLINNPNYSFLNNRKYLIPFAWIYRFILSVKIKSAKREINKTFKSLSISQKDENKRIDILSKWGL